MDYNHLDIERKWRKHWSENQTFKSEDNSEKEKYYVLDMFPYPSGAGLHVGHPLGYIASDIYARYKRLQGFNVLHPMGYDSFGLPAEQYAIQTGQHPEKTTKENIARYRTQLDKIGFSFDWSREVRTSDPSYYKWTQWIFIRLFDAWYNPVKDKAEDIQTLIDIFQTQGFSGNAGDALTGGIEHNIRPFSASEWKEFEESKQREILMHFRLAYLDNTWVNWCPALGTVLANDEVVNGVSERGGHPVERKKMQQWSLRITAYAERLLTGLDGLDWTESIKDMQRNWIGKSKGCTIRFKTADDKHNIEVFTTRPDTIFGVSYVTLAPEHDLVSQLTTEENKEKIEAYVAYAKNRSERERQADVKNITGEFTGAYVIHPFTQQQIPVWIGDYVLAGYGTGAVMAVPSHDERDYRFAKHFSLPRPVVVEAPQDWDFEQEAWVEKSGKIVNSDFLNGLDVKQAVVKAIEEIEKAGIGLGKVNYRLRDAVFGRQRYWGEPIPVYYKNGLPYTMDEADLPLNLPEVDKFLPTEDGEPPLARANNWKYKDEYEYEKTTMPGWAGSSWYFLRYMDPHNMQEFVSKAKVDYWKNVDLYIGGSEHATGHLLYSRFWTKFLFDLGFISFDEPFRKMINQGMILGRSSIVYRLSYSKQAEVEFKGEILISSKLKSVVDKHFDINQKLTSEENRLYEYVLNEIERLRNKIHIDSVNLATYAVPLNVDISFVDNDKLNIEDFKNWRNEFKNAEFIFEEDGTFLCSSEVEKMSKSKYNVQTPDELVEKFGADTLRMYEMFLGPLEQSKPWDTKGINGVSNFLRKLWRLFNFDENGAAQLHGETANDSLKSLHKCIQKVTTDLNRFSFNTGVSNFMICVNELTEQKCNSREILEQLVILMSPYAPHICEELWTKLGNAPGTVSYAKFPEFNPDYLVSDAFSYPVSFNGKVRFNLEFPTSMSPKEIEELVLADENTAKWLEGKSPKKVIVVPGRIVNVVV
ncbi:MAG: leucine--tRNA ligase [Crocinitomicaceae bacterium]|jgi:leucyl-tRNA synthetase|nr:leucine--tRNA ligase [Crocinitomicaceae bacterium]